MTDERASDPETDGNGSDPGTRLEAVEGGKGEEAQAENEVRAPPERAKPGEAIASPWIPGIYYECGGPGNPEGKGCGQAGWILEQQHVFKMLSNGAVFQARCKGCGKMIECGPMPQQAPQPHIVGATPSDVDAVRRQMGKPAILNSRGNSI